MGDPRPGSPSNATVTTYTYLDLEMKVTDANGHTTRIAVRGTPLRYLLFAHPSPTLRTGHSELRYKPWGETGYSNGTLPKQRQFTGQIDESHIGYNSSTQVCSDPHVAEGDCSDEGAGLWRFGITVKDPDAWKKSDIEAIREGAFAAGKKVATRIGGDPWTAFHKAHGNIQFSMENTTETGWSCARTGGGVTCYNARGYIDPRIIVHEFGHVFNANMENTGLASPYDELGASTIVDTNGDLIQGVNDKGVWERTLKGYLGARAPDVYHGEEYSDWNNVGEDFADMYMNWVFNTFSADLAGAARYNWMETHMGSWLDLIP